MISRGLFGSVMQGNVKLKSLAVETGAASLHRRSAMATMSVEMAQMNLGVQNVSALFFILRTRYSIYEFNAYK